MIYRSIQPKTIILVSEIEMWGTTTMKSAASLRTNPKKPNLSLPLRRQSPQLQLPHKIKTEISEQNQLSKTEGLQQKNQT